MVFTYTRVIKYQKGGHLGGPFSKEDRTNKINAILTKRGGLVTL